MSRLSRILKSPQPFTRRTQRDYRPIVALCEPRRLLSMGWRFAIHGSYPVPSSSGGTPPIVVSEAAVRRNLDAAGRLLSGVLPEWKGTADVSFSIVTGGGNSTGRGGGVPVGQQYLGTTTRDGQSLYVYEPDIIREARSGIDPAPSVEDIQLTFDANFLRDRVWIDTSPGLTGTVPSDKVDFISLVTHELMHGLGFYGYRSNGLATSVAFGSFVDSSRYSFDLLTSDPVSLIPMQSLSFVGKRAKALYGGPVPLTSVSPLSPGVTIDLLRSAFSHVGNPASSGLPGQNLAGDPMNGLETPLGRRYGSSDLALDAAILNDLLHVADKTDLMFVIDATGSMGDDIAAVVASASEITTSLFGEQPFSQIGVVAYRDQGDAFVARAVLALDDDPDRVKDALASIVVDGGGDFPESVYSETLLAINQGVGLNGWRNDGAAKSVIVMGDAPAHDPEPGTGYTLADVNEAARDGGVTVSLASVPRRATASMESVFTSEVGVRPVDIFTVAIGSNSATLASFRAIAEANRGAFFQAPRASDVVAALIQAIGTAAGAAANRAPIINAVDDVTVEEDETVRLTVRATDPDPGQTVSFSLTPDAPLSASIDPSTGEFTWSPRETDGPGVFPITVSVIDSGSPPFGSLVTFLVTVNEVNRPPTIAPIPDTVVDEGSTLMLKVLATDPDAPETALSYSLAEGAPAGMSIDPSTGVLTWTAPDGPVTTSVTIRATDAGSPSLSAVQTFLISARNLAPIVALPAQASVDAGTSLVRLAGVTDPGRDIARVMIDYGDGSVPVAYDSMPSNEVALVHTFGKAGRYTVRVTAMDRDGASASAVMEVDVNGYGSAPRLVVNDGSPQRSRITSLTMAFDRTVTVAPGALALRDERGRLVPLMVRQATHGGATVLTVQFGGLRAPHRALANGRYTLTVAGIRVTDSEGRPLDLDSDGRPGGDFVARFRALKGDRNGDGRVDRRDWPIRPLSSVLSRRP